MDFETLVRERRSIRGYKKDPVPKQLIEEIIGIAKGAPSSMNTQPWFFHVISGGHCKSRSNTGPRKRSDDLIVAE